MSFIEMSRNTLLKPSALNSQTILVPTTAKNFHVITGCLIASFSLVQVIGFWPFRLLTAIIRPSLSSYAWWICIPIFPRQVPAHSTSLLMWRARTSLVSDKRGVRSYWANAEGTLPGLGYNKIKYRHIKYCTNVSRVIHDR